MSVCVMCLVYTNCVHRCASVQVVYSSTVVQYILQINLYIYKVRACVCQVCELVITISKVNTDHIGVKHGLWPLRCPQRNLEFFIFGFAFATDIIITHIHLRPKVILRHLRDKNGFDGVIEPEMIQLYNKVSHVKKLLRKSENILTTHNCSTH
jgi:hypothetical protein